MEQVEVRDFFYQINSPWGKVEYALGTAPDVVLLSGFEPKSTDRGKSWLLLRDFLENLPNAEHSRIFLSEHLPEPARKILAEHFACLSFVGQPFLPQGPEKLSFFQKLRLVQKIYHVFYRIKERSLHAGSLDNETKKILLELAEGSPKWGGFFVSTYVRIGDFNKNERKQICLGLGEISTEKLPPAVRGLLVLLSKDEDEEISRTALKIMGRGTELV